MNEQTITQNMYTVANMLGTGQEVIRIHKKELCDEVESCSLKMQQINLIEEKEQEQYGYVNKREEKQYYNEKQLLLEELPWIKHDISSKEYITSFMLQKKIDSIKEEKESMYAAAVLEEGSITMNTLYECCYKENDIIIRDTVDQEVVAKTLDRIGYSLNAESSYAAKVLLTHNIEVTQKNMTKLLNLKNIVEQMEYEEKLQEEFEEVTHHSVLEKLPVMEGGEVLYTKEQVAAIVEELEVTNTNTIEECIKSKKDISINELRKKKLENTQKVLAEEVQRGEFTISQEEPLDGQETENSICYSDEISKVQEQIRVICSHLTVEAARKISEKLPVESIQLEKLATELIRVQEDEIKTAILKFPGNTIQMGVQEVKESLEYLSYLKNNKQYVIPIVTENNGILVKDIVEHIEKYQEMQTLPETKCSEDVYYIEDKIYSLLFEMDIKISKESVAAAKALIVRKMDITHFNMERAISITALVDQFIECTTPQTVVGIMAEGKQITRMTIGEIVDWEQMHHITQMKENIASAILLLEESGDVTKEKKQELISFYRVLNQLQSRKEEVVGYFLKSDVPITVKHMKEACHMLGESKSIDNRELGKSLETLLLSFKGSLDENWNQLLDNQFQEYMEYMKKQGQIPQYVRKKMDLVQKVPSTVLKTMDNLNIPITLNTIYWMSRWNQNGQELIPKEKVPEWSDKYGVTKLDDLVKEAKIRLSTMEKQANKGMEYSILKGDFEGYKEYRQVEEQVTFQKNILNQLGVYDVSFMVNGNEKMVQLFLPKSKKKQVEAQGTFIGVCYQTEKFGEITAQIHMMKNTIQFKILGKDQIINNRIEESKRRLYANIEQLGFTIKQVTIEQESMKEKKERIYKLGSSYFEEVI